jgi:hypothetical protein
METYFRSYQGGAGLDAVLVVRRACTRPEQAGEYPSLADLCACCWMRPLA